jgi:phosphoribosylamine---glycine ligase
MNVLLVGQGAREHALAWKIAQSPRLNKLYAAPGNPGIASLAECVDIRIDTSGATTDADIDRLIDYARLKAIDLVVVGPEDVLSVGLVDRLTAVGIAAFGPTQTAARIESSKAFAKELMASIGVPTAAHRTFTERDLAVEYIRQQGIPIVVKASGLAAGKGAIVCHTEKQALEAVDSMLGQGIFGSSGNEVVVEEYMSGEEASLFAICDGKDFVCLTTAQDHKTIFEGDKGPMTGGMGAYAPAPVMTPELIAEAEKTIIRPVLDEMARRGAPFQGVLYCGLMLTEHGPKVVEFNCRFGDPEAQVVLPLLGTDFIDLAEAACNGKLKDFKLEFVNGATCCVVMASGGYPGDYSTGKTIVGLDEIGVHQDLVVFHAGTSSHEGQTLSAGGRVLTIAAQAPDIRQAVKRAYQGIDMLSFDGHYYRRDIGHRALARLEN